MSKLAPFPPQFFLTAQQPCPYLEGCKERKLFTTLSITDADNLHNALAKQGFRRSQNVLYRPACTNCQSCFSARIPVDAFQPTKSQRRVMRKNAHLERGLYRPWSTEAQFELFEHYVHARHEDGGMSDMDVFDFAAMIEETPVNTQVIEYRAPTETGGKTLRAVCLTDLLEDGVSMVYSFFDPDFAHDSLGTYMILDHIQLARELCLNYVYLGYWVPNSQKMDYKARFRPLQVYRGDTWQDADAVSADSAAHNVLDIDTISDQVSKLEIPKPTR